jgi:Dullard-like phosphatase family protein
LDRFLSISLDRSTLYGSLLRSGRLGAAESRGWASPRPAKTKRMRRRLTVVLDLDETLVHTFRSRSASATVDGAAGCERGDETTLETDDSSPESLVEERTRSATPAARALDAACAERKFSPRNPPPHNPSPGLSNFCVEDEGEILTVNIRPGLENFLRRASERFELRVFTAGSRAYASQVIARIDPHGRFFGHRLQFRKDCVERSGLLLKDLRRVPGIDLSRTVLVDNNPLSYALQPRNGIHIANFFDDPGDRTLDSLLRLLTALDEADDVRVELGGR